MADRKPLARYGAIEGALARSLLRLLHHFPGPDHLAHENERAATLNDSAAALEYACSLAQELRTNGGHNDPGLVVTVRNEMRQIVLSIPFHPACA